jgi:pimeloyl-ACP methyl ester carboxylesterase
MISLTDLGRQAGGVGAAVGVLAAGAAVGLAAERYAVGRSFRGHDPLRREAFGALRGRVVPLEAADGVRLHVEVDEAPQAGSLTIVFCHGYCLTQDSWHFQRRDLGRLGRLVFYDQRGHGRSGKGDTARADIDILGDDLRRVIEATAPTGPVILVGHSMGGMTVMALADDFPHLFGERVVGVALISTSSGGLAEVTLGVPAALGRVAHRVAPQVLNHLSRKPKLVERGWRMGSDLGYVITKRYSYASDVPPSLVEFTAEMISSTPIEVISEFFPAFVAHDKLAALPVLDGIETLVLVGDQDALTPAGHSAAMVEALPSAELVVVDRAGHLVMLEHPDQVNAHLRALAGRALRAVG